MQSEANSLETTATSNSGNKWEYKCIFCSKTFNSGRALGGHQNAHRFEPRESKRTHHLRIPKQDDVHSAARMNVRPQTTVNVPPQPRPRGGANGFTTTTFSPSHAQLIQPVGSTMGLGLGLQQQDPRRLGFAARNKFVTSQAMAGPGMPLTLPSMATSRPRYNFYQEDQQQEWEALIARAGQGGAQSDLNFRAATAAANGVEDGDAELDLELKLYF